MARFVVPIGQSSAGGGPPGADEDDYLDRVAKYIPAEILSAYVALLNAAPSATDPEDGPLRSGMLLAAAVGCFVLTPVYLYLRRDPALPKRLHMTLSTVAFVIWSYALGGIWIDWKLYHAPVAAAALIFFTLIAGAFAPKPGDP